MTKANEAERTNMNYRKIVLGSVLIVAVTMAAWVLVTVSKANEVPTSDFVTLPNTPLSTQGEKVAFVSVRAVFRGGVAVGVQGFLTTSSGAPIPGATVYITYFLRNAYRTQTATTGPDGHFEALFPMNWTGWLPVTITYFGDTQHQGLQQVFSVSGET